MGMSLFKPVTSSAAARSTTLLVFALGFCTAGCAKDRNPVGPDIVNGPEAVSVVTNCVVPPQPEVGNLKIVADLTYIDTNGERIFLDAAWRPDLQGRRRGVVLFVHGGAWREGTRRDYAVEMLQAAQLGYLAASIDYRLAPGVQFPIPVQDVRCATRFMKVLAGEIAFDSSRVMLVGVSAGAQLSLIAAGDISNQPSACPALAASSHVTAVTSISGVYDLRQNALPSSELQQAVAAYLGATPEAAPLVAAAASPMVVKSGNIATLLLHGAADVLIPLKQATDYRNELARRGARATLVTIPGANHYFLPFDSTAPFRSSACTLISFMQQELGAP